GRGSTSGGRAVLGLGGGVGYLRDGGTGSVLRDAGAQCEGQDSCRGGCHNPAPCVLYHIHVTRLAWSPLVGKGFVNRWVVRPLGDVDLSRHARINWTFN